MLRPTTFLIVAAVALAACATRQNYEQSLNGWIGHKTDELAASWGPPSSTQNLSDGGRLVTYDSQRSRSIPTGALTEPTTTYIKGTPVEGGRGSTYGSSTGYVIYTPPARVVMECVTKFTTDGSGKIVSWSAEGNDCVS